MTFKYSLIKSIILLLTILASFLTANYSYAHAGPLNKLAVSACENKNKSNACSYEGTHNDLYIGTCQYMANDLMCVRNQPIQKIQNKKAKPEAGQNHVHEVINN
tara:strand:+ start:717 stop:1028 length:312 start_codon:yes stop_codon:yes gene_type:complete